MRTQWSLGGYALGGTKRRGGWLVTPYVSLWRNQWLFGVAWDKDAFEDPDPKVSLHLGPVVLWVRFLRILPGFRAARRAHRQRVRTSRQHERVPDMPANSRKHHTERPPDDQP